MSPSHVILALVTTSIGNNVSGGFFRGVWLLPRDEPLGTSISCSGLWVVDPSEVGLLNQILDDTYSASTRRSTPSRTQAPVMLIIVANGFIGASLGMIIFTSAIRGIPEHLFHAARVDGAGTLSVIPSHITLPALRWPISHSSPSIRRCRCW